MAISSQDLANDIRFALDAEGADHYDNLLDIVPAINLSVKWLVNVVNRTMSQKKLGEEIFRDLTEAKVFQLSSDNRLSLPDLGNESLWTILAVYPNPVTGNSGQANNPATLTIREDLYHKSSKESCKRLSIEEWSYNVNNPFEAGNTFEKCPELTQSAYLAPFDYNSGRVDFREIEVRPRPKNDLVSVFYVKNPTDITVLGVNDIQFPKSVYNLVFNKALNYISYKQGDGTALFSVSQNDVQMLLNTIL